MNHDQRVRVLDWANVLRSGEYAQTTGHLRDESGYCCLGVACDRWNAPDEVSTDWEPSGNLFLFSVDSGDEFATPERHRSMPPMDVMREHYGLTDNECDHLADMNDNGESFATIADWLTGRVERSLRIAAANTRRAAASA